MATKRVPAWAKDATWAAECGESDDSWPRRFKEIDGTIWMSFRERVGKWSDFEQMNDGGLVRRFVLMGDAKGYPDLFPNFRIVKGGGK